MSKSSVSTRRDANGISRFDKLVQSTIRLYDILPKALAGGDDEHKTKEKNPIFRSIVQSNLEHLKSIRPAAGTFSKMHQLLRSSRILPVRQNPSSKAASFSKRKSVSSSSHNATFDLASMTRKQKSQPLLLKAPSNFLVSSSKSLYEQHKALLRQRYATAATKTSTSLSPMSSTEFQQKEQDQEAIDNDNIDTNQHNNQSPSSSTFPMNSKEANNNNGVATSDGGASPTTYSADFSTTSSPSKELEKYIGFTSKLQEAIRTSSSFLHLQQDTRSAYAA
jgi:hypothetical protein